MQPFGRFSPAELIDEVSVARKWRETMTVESVNKPINFLNLSKMSLSYKRNNELQLVRRNQL
jgi:hypothetical protein